MQLRVSDDKKRAQYRFKENEGLQFAFDVEQDRPEEVVQQMIEQQHIPDGDTLMITKLIRDKVDAFKRDREYKHAEMKRQKEEEERKAEEAAVKEEIKARREREKAAAAEKAALESAASQVLNINNHQQEVVNSNSTSQAVQDSDANAEIVASQPQLSAAAISPATVAAARKSKKKIIIEVLKVYTEAQQTVSFEFIGFEVSEEFLEG